MKTKKSKTSNEDNVLSGAFVPDASENGRAIGGRTSAARAAEPQSEGTPTVDVFYAAPQRQQMMPPPPSHTAALSLPLAYDSEPPPNRKAAVPRGEERDSGRMVPWEERVAIAQEGQGHPPNKMVSPVGRDSRPGLPPPSPRDQSSTSVSSSHRRMTTPPQYQMHYQKSMPLPPSPNTMGLIDQMKRSILPPGAPLQGLTPPREEQLRQQQYYDENSSHHHHNYHNDNHSSFPQQLQQPYYRDYHPPRPDTDDEADGERSMGGYGRAAASPALRADDDDRVPERGNERRLDLQPQQQQHQHQQQGDGTAPPRQLNTRPTPSSADTRTTASHHSSDGSPDDAGSAPGRRPGERADTPKGLPPMLRLTPPSSPSIPPLSASAAAAAPSNSRHPASSSTLEEKDAAVVVNRRATASGADLSALGVASGMTSSPTRTNTTKMPSPETSASLLYHQSPQTQNGAGTTSTASRPGQRPTSPLPTTTTTTRDTSSPIASPGSRSPALISPRGTAGGADVNDASGSSILDASGGGGSKQSSKKKKKPLPNFSVSSVLLSPNKAKDRKSPPRTGAGAGVTGTGTTTSGYVVGGGAKNRALSPPQTVVDHPSYSADPSSLNTSTFQKHQETPLLRPSGAGSKYQHPSANTSSVDNSFLKAATTAPKTPSEEEHSTDADLVPPPPAKPLSKFVSLDDLPASVAARTGSEERPTSAFKATPTASKTSGGTATSKAGAGIDSSSKLSSTGPVSSVQARNSQNNTGKLSASAPIPSKNSPTDKRASNIPLSSPTLPPKATSVSLDDLPASAAVRKASRDSSPAFHDLPEGSPTGDRPKSLSVSFDEVMTSAVRASSVAIANSTLSQFSSSDRKASNTAQPNGGARKMSVDSTSKSRSPPADPTKVYCRHCEKEISKAGRYVHEGNCEMRHVKCPKCTKSFLAKELATHLCIAVKKTKPMPAPLPSSSSADGDGSGRGERNGSDSKRDEPGAAAPRSGVGSLNASVNGSSDIRASSVMLQETQRELQALLEEEAAMEAKKKAAAGK